MLNVFNSKKLVSSKERLNGYKRALKDNKVKFIPDFILSGDFIVDSGYLSVKKYLKEHGLNFIAIFAANDQMAIGATKALNDKGTSVTDEVSIVGFDDSYLSPYVIPPLTTIKQRREEMGKTAAELLLDRISSHHKKERTPRQIIIPVELIERESAISLSSKQRR